MTEQLPQDQSPLVAALMGGAPVVDRALDAEATQANATVSAMQTEATAVMNPHGGAHNEQLRGNWDGLTTLVAPDGTERTPQEAEATASAARLRSLNVTPAGNRANTVPAQANRALSGSFLAALATGGDAHPAETARTEVSEGALMGVEMVRSGDIAQAGEELAGAIKEADGFTELRDTATAITEGAKALVAPAKEALETIGKQLYPSDVAAVTAAADHMGPLNALSGEYEDAHTKLGGHQGELTGRVQTISNSLDQGEEKLRDATESLSGMGRSYDAATPDGEYIAGTAAAADGARSMVAAKCDQMADMIDSLEGSTDLPALLSPGDMHSAITVLRGRLLDYDGTEEAFAMIGEALQNVAGYVNHITSSFEGVERYDAEMVDAVVQVRADLEHVMNQPLFKPAR